MCIRHILLPVQHLKQYDFYRLVSSSSNERHIFDIRWKSQQFKKALNSFFIRATKTTFIYLRLLTEALDIRWQRKQLKKALKLFFRGRDDNDDIYLGASVDGGPGALPGEFAGLVLGFLWRGHVGLDVPAVQVLVRLWNRYRYEKPCDGNPEWFIPDLDLARLFKNSGLRKRFQFYPDPAPIMLNMLEHLKKLPVRYRTV